MKPNYIKMEFYQVLINANVRIIPFIFKQITQIKFLAVAFDAKILNVD